MDVCMYGCMCGWMDYQDPAINAMEDACAGVIRPHMLNKVKRTGHKVK